MAEADFDFDGLAAELYADSANGLLDRQLERAKKWMASQSQAGGEVDLRSFTQQCMAEPNQRKHLIVAHCAAMWRMIHEGSK